MDNKKDTSKTTTVPDGIKSWSWGASCLNGLRGFGNRTFAALHGFVTVLNFFMGFILGFYGRKWACKNRHWESVDHFNRVQKNGILQG